jgi:hypothetical protein
VQSPERCLITAFPATGFLLCESVAVLAGSGSAMHCGYGRGRDRDPLNVGAWTDVT